MADPKDQRDPMARLVALLLGGGGCEHEARAQQLGYVILALAHRAGGKLEIHQREVDQLSGLGLGLKLKPNMETQVLTITIVSEEEVVRNNAPSSESMQ